MADKSTFTPDEWKLLLESVMMAGIAVSAADPSGFAGGTALAAAKTDPTARPLIKAVVADFETSQGRTIARDGLAEKLKGLKPAELTAKCIETLGQAGAFKAWLRQISQHVAEASGEGGLFGSGGSPVSDKEKATLSEISSALKLAA